MAHLVMHRGETRTFPMEVNTTPEGEDVDLAGAALQFVAYTAPDVAPLIDVAATVTDAPAGLVDVTIPAADTDTADFSETQNTTLYYVLRRTVGGFTDVLDVGMLIVRAIA